MYVVNRSCEATGSAARAGGKTAKPGKRSVCIIPGGVIIPESWKQAGDALVEIILISLVTETARNPSPPPPAKRIPCHSALRTAATTASTSKGSL